METMFAINPRTARFVRTIVEAVLLNVVMQPVMRLKPATIAQRIAERVARPPNAEINHATNPRRLVVAVQRTAGSALRNVETENAKHQKNKPAPKIAHLLKGVEMVRATAQSCVMNAGKIVVLAHLCAVMGGVARRKHVPTAL